ncbi:PEP-CTERM sorting domain-containing protein [Chamaesiphon sp. VAR_48_metabat_135_sub]|uniref:PEP-CTERM sorting domain-containing protein n=1 Tax=Chamaesiphon sp. VAR_48_metabat_135_sub TaxID=2964699 RepID=UPI00286D31DA|nr:PEP-CTERM sorting domain-containing protein [Chamaesiphon sp. VAR_48_metabat_135_sub]
MQKSITSSLLLGVATTSITNLALFFGTNSAQAATVQFTDLASFQANTTGLTTIDFEGLAGPGGIVNYPSLTTGGVTFTSGQFIYVVDSAFGSPNFNWGSGASLMAPGATLLTATLPPGVTAIGSDIMSEVLYSKLFDITLSTGETFNLLSLARPNRKFIGFTSDTAISSISFLASGTRTEIDNFTFGMANTAATSVPEPFTIIGTLVGGTSALRMRKKLKSVRK